MRAARLTGLRHAAMMTAGSVTGTVIKTLPATIAAAQPDAEIPRAREARPS
jgi:hypothetical protein